MSNILSEMISSLVRYAEIISNITNSAVSIIDNNFIRLLYIGGDWRHDVNESCADVAHIARAALETGQSQIMTEPAGHPACQKCTHRNECKEKVEMWTPIIVNHETLGLLGFVAETEATEDKILAEPQIYLEFLEKIADLIGYEAMHLIENQRNRSLITFLESILEQLDFGVLILNQNNMISRINKMGKSILKDKLYYFEQLPIQIHATGNSIDHFTEFELIQEREHFFVAGNLHNLNIGEYSTVLIFNDAKKLLASKNKISSYHSIIGTSKEMKNIRAKVKMAANSPSSVLIHAEDGLNKELYARAIHDESERSDKPLVIIDCPTLPGANTEKYLFGTAPSANSTGSHGRIGRIEAANGGTLVLHNIETLPLEIQQKLVQLIDTKKITRVGSRKTRSINIRIIATTKKDLRKMAAEGTFNTNLYYSISVIPITIPPLRNRKEDIHPLAIMYINNYAKILNKTIHKIDDGFWHIIETYDWPGNIQELKNAMEYVVNMLMHSDTIHIELLPEQIRPMIDNHVSVHLTLEEMEKEHILRALNFYEKDGYTREEIARLLGIGPATLYRKLKKYGLQ